MTKNDSGSSDKLDNIDQPQEDVNTNKLEPSKDKISFGSIVLSTFAAAVGVQNKKALEKDFSNSSPLPFIVAGIIFTVLFMGTIIIIANIAVGD